MCRWVAFAAMVVLAAHGTAADKSGFLDRTLKGPDGVEAKYVVFVPHKLEAGKKPPVILFLHGAFRIGTDGKRQHLEPLVGRHLLDALGTLAFDVRLCPQPACLFLEAIEPRG